MIIAEVVEIKSAYKPNQKDDRGNPLPLGSIEVRIGSHQSNLGQVRNVYAAPAFWNSRMPLVGEQILLISGPSNDWSTSSNKGTGFFYIAPINGVDSVVLHAFPQLWKRKSTASSTGNAGQRKSDKEEFGYTFPQKPRNVDPLQPYDGNDIYQGRHGQSIRLGSTVSGDTSVYSKQPSWKGGKPDDPIMILRINSKSGAGNKYTVEDLKEDDASIYLTSKQSLNSLKAGFDKNMDAKQLGNWMQGSQIVADADRLVINAKKDMLFLIGSKQVTVTGKKVLFQSDKYKVDLDALMDFLSDWLKLDSDLTSGTAQFSTPAGPTAVATSMADYVKLKTVEFMKFKQP